MSVDGAHPLMSEKLNVRIEFNRNHNLHWGRLMNPEDVKVEWHGMPSAPVLFLTSLTSF